MCDEFQPLTEDQINSMTDGGDLYRAYLRLWRALKVSEPEVKALGSLTFGDMDEVLMPEGG